MDLEQKIDNILIRQKDKIRSLILSGKYDEAKFLLKFSEEFWKEMDYHYKWKELMHLIKSEQY